MKTHHRMSVVTVSLTILMALISCGGPSPPPAPQEPPAVTVLSEGAKEKWNEILSAVEENGKRQATAAANVTSPKAEPPSPVPVAPPPASVVAPPAPVPAPAPVVPAPAPIPSATPALTAARDLTGTWRGTGISYEIDGGTAKRIIKITWDVTLALAQKDSAVTGNITMRKTKQENLVPVDIQVPNYGPDPITSGRASSTSLYFTVDDWKWEFTFTTDLMSGHFTAPGPVSSCDPKTFVLTRQK